MDNKYDYFSKFYALGYTHNEIEELLKKIAISELLTKEEYDILINAIDIVTSLTTFDGSYDSLRNKPDIVDVIRQANEFVTYASFDARAKTIYVNLEQALIKMMQELKFEMDQTKADIDHEHDDRYSLLNHMHEGVYVTQEERRKDLKELVTKDYLNSVIAGLGGGGTGGGGVYPTYVKPKLTAASNMSLIPHKQPTPVIITPTYSQNDGGDLINFVIRRNDEIVYEGVEIKSYVEEVYLLHGEAITYTFIVEYGDGEIKNTINGDPYPDTMVKAGTITAGVTIKGFADSYYGVIDDKEFEIDDIANLTSIRNTSKALTNTYTINEQKSVYMYPESFGKIESIKDANNFEYINSYTFITIEYDDVTYNVYVLTDAVTVDGGFKQVFS